MLRDLHKAAQRGRHLIRLMLIALFGTIVLAAAPVLAQPVVMGVSPATGTGSVVTTITLNGTNFGSGSDTLAVTYNGGYTCANPTRISPTSLTCQIGTDVSAGMAVSFIVKVNGVPGVPSTATFTANAPVITSISPSTILPSGGTITITGTGFNLSGASNNIIKFSPAVRADPESS